MLHNKGTSTIDELKNNWKGQEGAMNNHARKDQNKDHLRDCQRFHQTVLLLMDYITMETSGSAFSRKSIINAT